MSRSDREVVFYTLAQLADAATTDEEEAQAGPSEPVLTPTQAAILLGISRHAFYRLVRAGKAPRQIARAAYSRAAIEALAHSRSDSSATRRPLE